VAQEDPGLDLVVQEAKELEDQDQEGKGLKDQAEKDLEVPLEEKDPEVPQEEKDLEVPQEEKEGRQDHQQDVHHLSLINLMLLLGKRNISANLQLYSKEIMLIQRSQKESAVG